MSRIVTKPQYFIDTKLPLTVYHSQVSGEDAAVQPAVQLFFNPVSGDYCPRRIARLRSALEAAGARTIVSESSARVAPVIDRDATHVCVAGGDGTVRHVVEAMSAGSSALPLAQYPAGTINLLARELGYPAKPSAFARRLLEATGSRDHYTASIQDQLFLCCASVGPDSEAVARHSPRLKRSIGRMAYAVSFLGTLLRWKRPKLELVVDGAIIPCEAVYIAKGRYFAGPWSFAPHAAMTDPKLHVVALGKARRLDYLVFAMDLARGRDPGLRENNVSLTCTSLQIRCDEDLPVQADGDIIATLPINVSTSAKPTPFL